MMEVMVAEIKVPRASVFSVFGFIKAPLLKRWAIRPQGDVRVGWVGGFWPSGWKKLKKDTPFPASPRGGIGYSRI
jgi:hypothetical protein